MKRRLCLLGSTGSIGVNTLDVVRAHPERYEIAALSAHSRVEVLAEQIREFRPSAAAIGHHELVEGLRDLAGGSLARLYAGAEGLCRLVDECDADLVVNALVGAAGLPPTLRAIERGLPVALANKETMVVAGELVSGLAARRGVAIIPIDSEHNAVWQCLAGERPEDVRRIHLTASGGPFRERPAETLADVTPEEALRHPNWSMGPKITIDSATMMNKGLEVIEARWLFQQPAERIRIVVHPQSIIHSMVEFIDGSFKAQLGAPDMRLPIQYALGYPERLPRRWDIFDPLKARTLEFFPPDPEKFPAIRLAYAALETGGTMPAVLNAANEAAVALFLSRQIGFTQIAELIEQAMQTHTAVASPSLDDLLAANRWAREFVEEQCKVRSV